MKTLCIFHKSCADGFGAALAVYMFFKDKGGCNFLAAQYGDKAPDVSGLDVVIVDFSYPRDVLVEMEEQANSLLVLDHHKTAEKHLCGLDFCTFDMERSGAVMAWEHFHPNIPVPLMLQYIQDRDLWLWNMSDSKEFSAGLNLVGMEFEQWEFYLINDNCSDLIEKGKIVLSYQEQEIVRATKPEKVRMINLCGYDVPILNTTTLISEICGKLAEKKPFAVTYFDTIDQRIYSLRSCNKTGMDVSEIAKSFGGGGHKHAAGFSIPLDKQQL